MQITDHLYFAYKLEEKKNRFGIGAMAMALIVVALKLCYGLRKIDVCPIIQGIQFPHFMHLLKSIQECQYLGTP